MQVLSNIPAGRVMLGYPAMKIDTQLEVYRNLRKLPKIVKELAKIKSRFQVNEDRLNFRFVEEANNMDIGAKVIDIIAEQAILDPIDVTLERLIALALTAWLWWKVYLQLKKHLIFKFLLM